MDNNIWLQMKDYFAENMGDFLIAVKEHLEVSLIALLIAIIIGISCGYVCFKYKKMESKIIPFFQVLRVIPSLAILLLLIPIMGTGIKSAIIALVLLSVPPVLMNTVVGIKEVPGFLIESAYGMGMTERQVFWKVQLPLALPLIFTGIKIATIEIIASATLAAKIGSGGIGEIIFTGLGLNRTDLLVIGGITVGLMTILASFIIELINRMLMRYKYLK
ncbi:osmoprotectant transport system permease protein [Gracilibacillus ureilyticus]|uniref:Osmoprotectant transport system permease protein n=1 Tax=Gracilibacillus ureilyticus TaxID=531814 RepID=A0A1H9T954_9BACI|nr:ABC transporter permease [Gracilibacillus ureilyticus]SER93775.1 osmoprotectant transport system permease protein [Gracilibacillus ureilyticus]